VPTSEDQKPRDPVSENMSALVGKPMKAFIHQDHDAHIATHTAFMQDPMIAQTIGQNPQAQQIMASLQAHIAEHLGFSYRKQMEERLGVTLPPPDEQLPNDIEVELSKLIADGGKQLAEQHKQQAAQTQAQQQAEDPLFQLEQAKVKVQQMEVARKAQKDLTDADIAAAKLVLEKERNQLQAEQSSQQTQAQNEQNMQRVKSQDAQAQQRMKLDALKILATSKPQAKKE
jgi:hypothetical protein